MGNKFTDSSLKYIEITKTGEKAETIEKDTKPPKKEDESLPVHHN